MIVLNERDLFVIISMQHNFLSNFCLFSTVIDTTECYKILSVLNSMSIQRLPLKQLEVALYEGRREIKQMNRPKQKNLRTEFELTVIGDEDVRFMFNREKSTNTDARGHMTISNNVFLDILQRNKLIGEVSFIRTCRLTLESFVWENYIITHYEINKEKSLLIFQEMFSSTLFNLNNEEPELLKKTKFLFEPLLELMFNSERAAAELSKFQRELRALRNIYPEIDREIDKEKGIVEINYCLIYYYIIMQAGKETESF